MKRRHIILIILLLVLFTPLWSWIAWNFQTNYVIDILILDKTVLNKSVQEHVSLNWVLNQYKILKPDSSLYTAENDYLGLFPDEEGSYTINDLSELSDATLDSLSSLKDMAYYADMYGVYEAEWYDAYPEAAPENYDIKEAHEKSRLLYGGMQKNDMQFLKYMKQKEKLVITEFNVMASPTSSKIRKEFENEFGVKWSGWVGRSFVSLDTAINKELPKWLTENYMNQNDSTWPFTKAGIVLVHSNDKIVVLEDQTHLEKAVPYIHTTDEFSELYKLPEKIKYPFWFDICSYEKNNKEISKYQLHTNAKGDSILKINYIPKSFPAVIASIHTSPFYYFAGDFADNPISLKSSKLKKVDLLSSLTYEPNTQERNSFFWDYYRPLMQTIIENIKMANHIN